MPNIYFNRINEESSRRRSWSMTTRIHSLPFHFSAAETLRSRHDAPGTDEVISVTSEQSLAVSRPSQGDTLRLAALLADRSELRLELINLGLLLEIEDDDGAGSSSAEPVAVGGEDEGVDLIVGVKGVQVLGLVEVPEHGGAILATRSAEGAVRRNGDGVDVAGVTDVVSLKLAAGELPDLTSQLALSVQQSYVVSLPCCDEMDSQSFAQGKW